MDRERWIVVGIDFSDGAARALEQAVSLAARVGASIACVHAYEDAPGTPLREDRSPTMCDDLHRVIERSGALAKGIHVQAFIRRGAPWEKLLNVASELGAGLIVVGASGENEAPRQHFLGTVATRLAVISTRMVLIVPEHVDVPRAFEDKAGAA